MAEIPNTVIECDGACGEPLNVLGTHLKLTLKPQRQVMMSVDTEPENPEEVPEQTLYLGRKSGRGVIRFFHGFDCAIAYMTKFEGKEAKLEYHHEDEIYVPDDNRTPEELIEDGEWSEEQAVAYFATQEAVEAVREGSDK